MSYKVSNGKYTFYFKDKNNAVYHREDGPAVIYDDGSKFWYINGKRHRADGPAVEHGSGTKEWFINGERHRENGPAIIYSDGDEYYYLNDVRYSKEYYWVKIKFDGFV